MSRNLKNSVVNFNILGAVGLRLENPSNSDIKIITKKFEILPVALEIEPDIIISYVDELEFSNLTYIGLNTAGYSDEGFFILSNGNENVKVKLPFEDIGYRQLKIVCESGSPDIPMLNHIINLILLRKGYLPLHSTAFTYNGCGILVMGWAKGGKSESLFSFMKNGGEYVSDEVSIISDNGEEILGIKVPICIWEWQFKEISNFLPSLSIRKKILFFVIHSINAIYKRFNIKSLRKISVLLNTQLNIKVLPSRIFSKDKITERTKLDKIVLALSHDSDEIIVEKIPALEIIDKMIYSQMYELDYFFRFYNIFKYAFPYKKNEFLDKIDVIQYNLMKNLLSEKDAYTVKHPYPVSFDRLFCKMKTILTDEQMKTLNPKNSSIPGVIEK